MFIDKRTDQWTCHLVMSNMEKLIRWWKYCCFSIWGINGRCFKKILPELWGHVHQQSQMFIFENFPQENISKNIRKWDFPKVKELEKPKPEIYYYLSSSAAP